MLWQDKSLASSKTAHDERVGQPPVEQCASHRYWRLKQRDGHIEGGPRSRHMGVA